MDVREVVRFDGQGGYGVRAHLAVDRLSGKGMAELVRRDMSDVGRFGLVGQDLAQMIPGQRSPSPHEQPVRARQSWSAVGDQIVQVHFQPRVQGHKPVVVELADRRAQPVGRADLDRGVDCQAHQLTTTHARPGQQSRDEVR
jgi:hypothetical protein